MQCITVLTERACVALATSASIAANVSANVYPGLDWEEKEAPAIICGATNATEDFPESGVWHVKTNIIVKEMASDIKDSIGVLSSAVFARFLNGDTAITELKNAVSNYGVYGIIIDGMTNSTSGDAFVTTLALDIVSVLTD